MIQKFFRKFIDFSKEKTEILNQAQKQAKELIINAQAQAQEIMKEALELEKRLAKHEDQLEEKEKNLNFEKERIERLKKEVESIKKDLESRREELIVRLEKVAQMTKEEAQQVFFNYWEEKLKKELANRIKSTEEEIKKNIDEKAKNLLAEAMRYGATDYAAEYTLSVVNLPNEEFKGRIIGKEGRNIRAFEIATGVDVDLEEEGVIRLSSFDAIRREIARVSLERLIKDGRIQPKRIEEIVKKTKEEIEKIMFKAGEDLAHRVGVFNLPTEIISLLGKFKYRYSYGQNMIAHTLEETRIGVALAHELGADVNVVKLGCLLHDIGKVITEKEGSHVQLGVDLLKRYRFPQKVIDCVAAHHEDIPFPTVEAIIVYIADAVSGGRPGARHEDFQEYLKRIRTIEEIAKSKKGVLDAFALQAGRELRVIIKAQELTDEETIILSEKLKEELERKFEVFPGQIKITVIREFRVETTTEI